MTFTLMPRPARELAPAARRFGLAIGAVLAGFLVVSVALAGSHGPAIGAYSTRDTYSYVTEPSLHPPKIRVDKQTAPSDLAPGYILTANFFDLNEPPIIGQSGPLILDNKLQPVWFRPVPERVAAANLSLQTYEGKPALAWWQGVVTNTGATESGEYVVVNQHYQTVATLRGKEGWQLTLHEFVIKGDDVWVTANKDIPMDLSKYGGAYNGALIDSAVQEYDLKTGQLLYTWDALDHIPLQDSYATLPTNGFPWDAYHVNSIELTGNRTMLVSMRDTWAAYLVNLSSGAITWTLGGKRSNFALGPAASFEWQHDVRLQPDSTVTMFDDHCCQLTGGGTYVDATSPSRAITLKLDTQTRTASLVHQYGSEFGLNTDYMGSTQPLSGGKTFVGWGSSPYLSEFTASGKVLLDGVLPGSDLSYRATVARAPALTARRRRPPSGRAHHGVRELERRHPGRRLDGARRIERRD